MRDTTRDALADEILRRLDPGGELGDTLRSLAALQSQTFSRFILGSVLGGHEAQLRETVQEATDLGDFTAEATLLFFPLGWAPSGSTPAALYAEAVKAYNASGSTEDAERVLVEGWNDGDYFASFLRRLLSLGAGNEQLERAAHDRYRLVQIALDHHRKSEYAASIPILLAQAEGIVFDVTDGNFGLFSRLGDREHLSDDTTLAGMAVGVSALQKLIATRVDETSATGRLVRHGIMHGRELGYDTRPNSTKALVFLLAIIELAQPRARALADARRQAEEAEWAGSTEVDKSGARRDRRGFEHAKSCLRRIWTRMVAEYRRSKRYPVASLQELFPGEAGDRLVDHERSHLVVSPSGESYYAYHQTPTGWVFGIAGTEQPEIEYRFAGPNAPRGGIENDDWRGLMDQIPPDWAA